jgi:glycogen synthase
MSWIASTSTEEPNVRILMTADPIGGVWTYAIDLVRGLGEHDVQVVLATMGAPLTHSQRREVRALGNATLEESRFKLEWMPDPWHDVHAAGDWLLQLAQRHRVHAVHHNHLTHGHLNFGVPVLTVVHSCVLSWWHGVKHEAAPEYFDRYRREVRRSLIGSDAVVTVGHAMSHALQRHYGPLTDVSVVYNARQPGPVWRSQKEAVVFTAGRVWDAAKNVAAVVRAAPQLPWPVVVAGPAHAPDAVTDADDEVAATDRSAVHFTGRLTPRGMAGWYRRAAVYALPARYEPFGLTILEAAQAGCALVVGDIPSLRELWDGAAIFVPPDDDKALVRTLRHLLADERRWRGLAFAARRRAAVFSYDQFVRSYVLAYRTMMAAHGVAAPRARADDFPSLFDGVRMAPAS